MNATTEYQASTNYSAGEGPAGQAAEAGPLPLRRPAAGRMLGGVAAGIGLSLGVDPLFVRIAFVVLTFIGGAGLPLYLAGWLLIPDEESGQSIAASLLKSR